MARDKEKLEMTVAAIQERLGANAIRRLGEGAIAGRPHVPTGFPALDRALGIGGVPGGRLTEIAGAPTSGVATLALKILANAQAAGPATAVYLDVERTFDPDYAARCGVVLERLLLVRPASPRQALAMVVDFALNGGAGIVILDASLPLLADPPVAGLVGRSLGRLVAPLSRGATALLFLTTLPGLGAPPEHTPPAAYAAVRLLIQKERWLYRRGDIRGYQAQVLVRKNKLAAAGKQVTIAITFNSTVAGDTVTGEESG